MVPKDMGIRRDRKNMFCAADASLSQKKKISSFGRTVAEIFNFYSGKVTFGPPCIISPFFVVFEMLYLSSITNQKSVATITCSTGFVFLFSD